MQRLRLPARIWLEMCRHFAAWHPQEGCGLVFGEVSTDGTGQATDFVAGSNVLNSETRFRMADAEVVAAFRTMRRRNLELLAIAHSHPRTSAQPSETDLAEMHYPTAAMMIVSLANGTPEAGAWLLDSDKPVGYRKIIIEVTQD